MKKLLLVLLMVSFLLPSEVGRYQISISTATTKKGKDLLGKGFRTIGTKAMGPLWGASIVSENLKSGKGVAESILDPWLGAVLLGTGTDVSKITKNPLAQKILKAKFPEYFD